MNNGFPSYIFDSCVYRFINNMCNPSIASKNVNDNVKYCFCIPFFGNPSINFRKKLISLFKKHYDLPVSVVFKSSKVKNYFSNKDKTPISLKSMVVYKFSCQRDADLFYLGKTKRHLISRVKEHTKHSSQIGSHLLSCSNCKSNFSIDNFKVIAVGTNDFDTQIKEAICIKQLNPHLNRNILNCGSSYFLKVF